MIPGPRLILRPRGAKMLIKKETILSGYSFGWWHWSDGKLAPSMISDQLPLLKSPREGILYWEDECEEVGRLEDDILSLDFFSTPRWLRNGEEIRDKELIREWKHLPYGQEPSEEDYIKALESGMGDTAERVYSLRMRLWWKGNDPVRQASEVKHRGFLWWKSKKAPDTQEKLPDVLLENLEILLELHEGESPYQRIVRAELLRELGRFGEAAGLISHGIPGELKYYADAIKSLIEARDVKVAKVTDDRSYQKEEYARVQRELELDIKRFRELVISKGMATAKNVDRLIYDMELTSFNALAADFPTLSRAFFNPANIGHEIE
jgi:hypothetical protein